MTKQKTWMGATELLDRGAALGLFLRRLRPASKFALPESTSRYRYLGAPEAALALRRFQRRCQPTALKRFRKRAFGLWRRLDWWNESSGHYGYLREDAEDALKSLVFPPGTGEEVHKQQWRARSAWIDQAAAWMARRWPGPERLAEIGAIRDRVQAAALRRYATRYEGFPVLREWVEALRASEDARRGHGPDRQG